MNNEQLVSKVWNYAHVLRDQGVSYGDYVEQITYLLFLKMDQERVDLLGEPSSVPVEWNWSHLAGKSGDELVSFNTGTRSKNLPSRVAL
ncbi:type I restriction enzyme M protein [Ruegeria halocynthiae]|uniref:Type I restriction enzyme M protein n=1 Tax=Ruegeria halocynthiae TaxID=985054 RepID=A0A1H3B6K0_9RHOB|nr:type I restriction-modification system subunit M N-terminal domain-containing protein [Ruegeria halocynthiae]SDX36679.1 type I restriction enzyme M protein [Ruegeria halocynthiae]